MNLALAPPAFCGPAAAGALRAGGAALAEASIHVVDAHPERRAELARQLRGHGFRRVREVAGAEAALALSEGELPDLIVTGETMPGVSGCETCARLRGDPRFRRVPMLTAQEHGRSGNFAGEDCPAAIDPAARPHALAGLAARAAAMLEQDWLIRQLYDYRERMHQELELAREMQQALLPSPEKLQLISQRLPVEIASHYRGSMGLSGDLWGMSQRNRKRLGLFIADFVGHGVAAAFNTFRLHSFLQNPALALHTLGEVVVAMNRFLASTLTVGQFATLISARIDFSAGELEFCAAGGPPPLLRIGAEGPFQLVPSAGLPLGIDESTAYPVRRYPFPPGSRLVFYSDALIDTPLAPHAIFTSESLAEFANRREGFASCSALVQALLDRLEPFVPDDDLTIVAVGHKEAA